MMIVVVVVPAGTCGSTCAYVGIPGDPWLATCSSS